MYSERIKSFIETNRQAMIDDLMALVRIPSVKSEAEPHAPFGRECRNVLEAGAALAARLGLSAQCFHDDGYALASMGGGGGRTIGIFSHCDVVPAGGGWLYTTPFEPVVKDGYLIGRGIGDNKSAVVTGLYAMKAVRELDLPVKSRIVTFMGSDEECGMKDVEAFAKNQPMPDLCIVPDAAFPVCNGEKGIMDVTIGSETAFKQIITIDGGMAANVIISEAVAVIASSPELRAELESKLKSNERIVMTVDGNKLVLTATGITSHASRPDGSINAMRLLADLLKDCAALDAGDRKIMADASFALGDDYGVNMGIACEDENTGRTTVACGIVRAPQGKLQLVFNPRVCVSMPLDEIEAGFARFCAARGWRVIEATKSEGFYIEADSPLVAALLEACSQYVDLSHGKTYVMGGGTYSRKLKNACAFGPEFEEEPVPSFIPPGHGGAHQPDEYISIDSFFKAFEIYLNALILVDKALEAQA